MHGDGLAVADLDSTTRVQLAIDIGTRWVKIAYAGPDGLARLLPALAGGKPGLVPLLFYVPRDASRPLVGDDALRLLGRGDLIDFRKLAGAVVRLPDRTTTPGALYAELFRYMRSRARATVGDVVPDAPLLISVPPRLNQASRDVLEQAAHEAGFADTDFIELPVSIATAWASTVKGSASRSSMLLVDVGACAVSWALLDRQKDGGFRIDWTMPPGELRDHGAEDVELELLEYLSGSLAPPADRALRATRDVVQDELRRAKEQISVGSTAESILVDGHDIRVDERMVAKAASNLLDTVATLVAKQLAEFEDTGRRKPMVLLAGGGARTPGLAARLAALNVAVTTWEGQATGGATGALLSARRHAWVKLREQERAASRQRAKRLLAGTGCLLALFLSFGTLGWLIGWLIDEKGHTAALAAMHDGTPPAQAIATVEEYLTETPFRKVVAELTAPFADLEGHRTQTQTELANYAVRLANDGAAEMAALEHDFAWPPDSQSPAKLRAIMGEMRALTDLAPQAQQVSKHASQLAGLADAALGAAAARAEVSAATPSDPEWDRMTVADLERFRGPLNELHARRSGLAGARETLPEVPDEAGYVAFLRDLENTQQRLENLISRRAAAIVCLDARVELANPGTKPDWARIGRDLAQLSPDLCSGDVPRLQREFSAHERILSAIEKLRQDAAPLIEARRIPELRVLLAQGWRDAEFDDRIQRWFSAWLDERFAHAEDAELQRLPERIRNTTERDQVQQALLTFSDTAAGIGVFPYHRPDSITQRITALETEVARVAKVLSQGATVGRIEFFPREDNITHSVMTFGCSAGGVMIPSLRRVLTVTGGRDRSPFTLETKNHWNNPPDGFACSAETHASWTTNKVLFAQGYQIEVEDCGPLICGIRGDLIDQFQLSSDLLIWISDGGMVSVPLKDDYVLRLTGVQK